MLENDYLELVNQLKSKFDELELKEKRQAIKLNEMTKKLAVAYGAARMVDEMTIDCQLPTVMEFLISICRSTLSDVMFPDIEE
jgi:hypothetical protein|tara:strand:- start:1447 stop:1695 length:249 start_codon:yes stop_codon:yes gene_type:complete